MNGAHLNPLIIYDFEDRAHGTVRQVGTLSRGSGLDGVEGILTTANAILELRSVYFPDAGNFNEFLLVRHR